MQKTWSQYWLAYILALKKSKLFLWFPNLIMWLLNFAGSQKLSPLEIRCISLCTYDDHAAPTHIILF